MNTLTIRIRNKGRMGTFSYKYERMCCSSRSSYPSVKEMQKELIKRFPDRLHVRIRKIRNGIIRIEGPRCNRMTSIVTLEVN